ncbi:hypothetical protein [Bacillus cereus]|uniref:hypothetical protein n=1 Tax=Bacillus cereus TaxID=1396 RepID=UPI000BFD9BF8|nr:hypothetical protein [Bacillus cereus]PGR83590.1 hypothetical protein COC63_06285 [Bacillus cereus]
MSQMHVKVNINRLPIGTRFSCTNGGWEGEIVKEVGTKYVKAYDIQGVLQNVTPLTQEKGQRCKIDIRVRYLPKAVKPLPYKEGITYDSLDVLELPIGTVLFGEVDGWFGEVEIVERYRNKLAWLKKEGNTDRDNADVIGFFPTYEMFQVTIQALGEDLLLAEPVGERTLDETEAGMCY